MFIAADEREANKAKELFAALFLKKVHFYPQNDYCFADVSGASREWENLRLSVLSSILNEDNPIIITTADAVCRRTPPPEKIGMKSVAVGENLAQQDLVFYLVNCGYSKTGMVEGAGQFAVRGGIVDVFSPNMDAPARIEFFGDEIDQISIFEVESQRRISQQKSCSIAPARENVFDSETLAAKLKKLYNAAARKGNTAAASKLAADIEMIEAGISPENPDRFLNLIYDRIYTIFDYLKPETLIAVSESFDVEERIKNFSKLLSEDIKSALEKGALFGEMSHELALSKADFWRFAAKFPLAFFNLLPRGKYPIAPGFLLNFVSKQLPASGGNIDLLIEDIENYREKSYEISIFCGNEKRAESLADILRKKGYKLALLSADSDFTAGQDIICIFATPLPSGAEYSKAGIVFLCDGAVTGEHRKKRAFKKRAGEKIKTYNDLTVFDYVVHAAYGIGQYLGIEKLTVEGVTKDYIKIKYAGTDMLYVPAGQLDLLSKFVSGGEGAKVRLSKMGGTDWVKTKLRVKKSVGDMADGLIKLYAERSAVKGFAFSQDSDWQGDFEQSFVYRETDDQLRSAQEIKKDMEKPTPMDRLLCGDVGFGKTEVALRAAFKCVMDGKQCAILVPTTILAWQHYQTVLSRFSGFPVKADNLSRFRTPKQQKEIIKKLRRGEIDILIGTHRILQKDIVFKDLGLVIIDEEQRFGVTHKEKLKQMTKEVDCLTLTATPIPRTLNMALSGIRDLSLIEEAPGSRQPVQTYVVEHEKGLFEEAIRRELRRGGQVFYLHNRVESIVQCAAKLAEAFPDANIGIGHGKMAEEELSKVWGDMVSGDLDILVCTTIIETGIDIPNANTLIIEDADRLGLSQLYQIRGRVGRSERRAYVYFTYRRGKSLNEDAVKRLAAIKEFTEFNSGYKIAMRDLEIRGAGNVLGAEQHGHMESVGYDMYMKLLEEAVAERKGEIGTAAVPCVVDLFVSAHIPGTYIEAPEQRIDIYKKIAGIAYDEDLSDLFDELLDRFGDIPKPVETLCKIALIRGKAGKLGISSITHKRGILKIDAGRQSFKQITKIIEKSGKGTAFDASENAVVCKLQKDCDVIEKIFIMLKIIEDAGGKNTEKEN